MPKVGLYSREFKEEAVRLLRSSGRSVAQLAEELGVAQQSLRGWVSRAGIEEGKKPGLIAEEREELRRVRRENKILIEEREMLKKAVAFFAMDSVRTRR
jgi:transposase